MSHQSKLKKMREYRIWTNMKTRCFNPNCRFFDRYGGRGITVCDRWKTNFSAFLEDMGHCPEGLTLERINNDGNYDPANCIWATRFDQCNNRTSLRRFEYQGRNLTIAAWAREVGIPEGTIRNRLNRGEPISRALDRSLWHKKLSATQVEQIRMRLARGESHAAIANSFGVDRSTVTAVSCGKNWKDAAFPRVEIELTEAL